MEPVGCIRVIAVNVKEKLNPGIPFKSSHCPQSSEMLSCVGSRELSSLVVSLGRSVVGEGSMSSVVRESSVESFRIVWQAAFGIAICYVTSRGNLYASHASFNCLRLCSSDVDCNAAMRSVTLNLANKFSQCTFSVAEHYDLFSGLIILRQA